MRLPALKRFANPDVTRAVANLVGRGLERLTQIGVAIAISGVLARYFGPDVFGKWQYANTLLLVPSPITRSGRGHSRAAPSSDAPPAHWSEHLTGKRRSVPGAQFVHSPSRAFTASDGPPRPDQCGRRNAKRQTPHLVSGYRLACHSSERLNNGCNMNWTTFTPRAKKPLDVPPAVDI
jgi:hypothetical protein